MSSKSRGDFAKFFPTAPSVVQENKRKRAALDRDKIEEASSLLHETARGAVSPSDDPAISLHNGTKRRRLSPNEQELSAPETGGSAGSLTSTVSSVFSNSAMPLQNGTSLAPTPLTHHDSSPIGPSFSPPHSKSASDSKMVTHGEFADANGVAHHPSNKSYSLSPDSSSEPQRIDPRPGPGQPKGRRAVFDPMLVDKDSSSKDGHKLKIRYRTFGENGSSTAPDPRLSMPGYRDGNLTISLRGENRMWKHRRRPAPYLLPQYKWDTETSIGKGPATSIVVTGFDPFTSESQLRAVFGSYGEITSLDNKTDPNTGSFLGICWLRYKDRVTPRGVTLTAIDAAKRAVREGSGQRIGLQTVKAEEDRSGAKSKRYVDSASRRNHERRIKEQQAEDKRKPSKSSVGQALGSATPTEPAPPPNAPKGPSSRPAVHSPAHPPEGPRAAAIPPKNAAHALIETTPILPSLKRRPYLYIPNSSVPVMGTTIPHFKKRMKMFDWRDVRCDQDGYYIVFDESKRGSEECARCFERFNGDAMFTYTMNIVCQRDGNPNYERSPSPERAAAIKRKKELEERLVREEEQDQEEEKRQRALNLDPSLAALEQLRTELKEKILGDVKTRIAAPALYDFLDPVRHVDKRRKHNIPDPSERPQPQTPYFSLADTASSPKTPHYSLGQGGFTKKKGLTSLTISRVDRQRRPENTNVFADERRQRPVKRRAEALSLHHRLQDLYAADESDDEEKQSSREDAKDVDSQSVSRMSSVAPDDEARKNRRAEREESSRAEESGDEDMGIARKVLDPHLLKKEPEDMALAELQLVVNTLPWTSRLHKHAKKELDIRKRNRDDDRLFNVKTENDGPVVEDAGVVSDIAGLAKPGELLSMAKSTGKKGKAKKKSKKQIFEEREAAKAELKSSKDLVQEEAAPTPEAMSTIETEVEKLDEAEEDEEEERAEVEWGVSTDEPRRTVEDELDLVLDVDGWQHLIKDDEDLRFLRQALGDQPGADVGDVDAWVSGQKDIKHLNNGGIMGLSFETRFIKDYYVPNASGSARTEGVKKILESEKSKYLPHRIKVARARERRVAQKDDPAIAAEAARKAKLASNANSRSSRASNRTTIKDLNTVKQNLNIDGQQGDAIRFNQLKKRKKLVKFERSAIHGWGLYADENIAINDMIIEYVGEKVRQMVANIREMRYDKQGMGSSYLFRIDEDAVVDATKKGGIARFINHSCAPNCTAKIIRVDGTKRIVIYALKDITKNEELTYDYKFDRELDNNDRIPCLCGSEVCKGFLN